MALQITKEAYIKLIQEDLDFLNKHIPDGPIELDHIKLILCTSIDVFYSNIAIKMIKERAADSFCKQCNNDVAMCKLSKTTDYSCRDNCPAYHEFCESLI